MSRPLVLAFCEDDLARDQHFLRAFGAGTTSIKVIPLRGNVLQAKTERLIVKYASAAAVAGSKLTAIVVHTDADSLDPEPSRRAIRTRFQSVAARLSLSVIRCVPTPCVEAWLCAAMNLKPNRLRRTQLSSCDPWKKVWATGGGIDLDRVREAGAKARSALASRDDFQKFFDEWKAAGLE